MATRTSSPSPRSAISKSKLHAAEALLERAGRAIDEILDDPSEEAVAETAVKVAEAKVLNTEIAVLATNKLHELGGTRSTLGQYNFDRHWRNARTHAPAAIPARSRLSPSARSRPGHSDTG
jgi:alkylation response protein AidB-like acyl-CoA dehydrogenase